MRRDKVDVRRPVAMWNSEELLDGSLVKTFVLILRTRGCAWHRRGGCAMCGYNAESTDAVTPEHIAAQIDAAHARYGGEPVVKIYTSGSFLDTDEISDPVKILDGFFSKGAKRAVVESRPEFILKSLEVVSRFGSRLEVAIGLETSSDAVRERAIRKGFSFEDYRLAAGKIKSVGGRVRTYLLLKPPLVNEADAIEDCARSIEDCAPFSDVISVNPVNVQRGTPLERMWQRGEYRPPWLWSLAEVLRRGKASIQGSAVIVSDPAGGGTRRGVHNCPKCDSRLLSAVKSFSVSQDAGGLSVERCECAGEWRALMELEPSSFSTIDLARLAREDVLGGRDD